jgi:hypothetical protein
MSGKRSPFARRVIWVMVLAFGAAACSGGGEKAQVSAGSSTTTDSAIGTDTSTTVSVAPTTTGPVPPGRSATGRAAPSRRSATEVAAPGAQTKEPAPPRTPKKIKNPSGGLAGDVFPPGTDAYLYLTSGRCGQLLDEINAPPEPAVPGWGPRPQQDGEVADEEYYLYRGAANACLERWEAAASDFDRLAALAPTYGDGCPDPPTIEGECSRCERVVFAWLTDVVETYRKDPSLPPELIPGSPVGRGPC